MSFSNFTPLTTKFPGGNLIYHAICPSGDYVGRTKNLNNRIKKHLQEGKLSPRCKIAIKLQPTQKIAKVNEKKEICNTKPTLNKIKYKKFCRKLKKK